MSVKVGTVFMCFVPPAPVNKTNTAGNVYITTDHNEVVVSTAQVTKTALAEIKSTLDYLKPPRVGGGYSV